MAPAGAVRCGTFHARLIQPFDRRRMRWRSRTPTRRKARYLRERAHRVIHSHFANSAPPIATFHATDTDFLATACRFAGKPPRAHPTRRRQANALSDDAGRGGGRGRRERDAQVDD
jgi:hypothetical protein